MTSTLAEEDAKIARMKEKLTNDVRGKDETRSFLSFSRENLSISQSEFEKGFHKHRFRPARNTILTIVALSIAVLCLGLECWKFHRTVANAREIEELKRSVENLKHRFLEKDLLVKAFEEQLYAEQSDDDDDDDDPEETDLDNADYDTSFNDYDEESFSSHDYSSDYRTAPMYGARPSDFPDSSSTVAPVPSPPEPSPDRTMMKLLAALRKYEMKPDTKKNSRAKSVLEEKSYDRKNDTKEKRDAVEDVLVNWRMTLKRKRSIEERNGRSIANRNRSSSFRETSTDKTVNGEKQVMLVSSPRGHHPPKKYYTRSLQDASSRTRDNTSVDNVAKQPKRSLRRLRKNLHAPRQIFAVHYGGDKNGFTDKDEHTGNGRIRHAGKVFTSWKPNAWVQDLGMNEHFSLLNNGSVVVYKSGLYLAYAQIHYKDEHDEVGFHLLVNDEPIMQCVIDNSCSSHTNSQSCFSAQVTMLNRDDILVLKEIGSPKFALFNEEKSFFGLAKLGEFSNSRKSPPSQ